MSDLSRFHVLQQLLKDGKYFKLVCGAGNENAEEVFKLSLVYTLAGANGFDVSANPEIVTACHQGIKLAYKLQNDINVQIPIMPFITVSVGMPGDHHVRKAIINDNCVECDLCIPACPTDAITSDLIVVKDLCIGCGDCEAACPPKISAIEYEHNAKLLAEILPKCIQAGAENIELHAAVEDDVTIMEELKVICDSLPSNFISMCLDRYHLSNVHLIKRIKQAESIAGDRLMIQADGVPMSGGSDDENTTLQAIAIADIINKELLTKEKKYRNIPILLSGGTNSHTGILAKKFNVPFNGVSIGTHARKIIKNIIIHDNFVNDISLISNAVGIAKNLVDKNLIND